MQTVTAKRVGLRAVKVLTAVAALVFVFAPTATFSGLVLFVSSIVMLLLCFIVWSLLGGADNVGSPPRKPD